MYKKYQQQKKKIDIFSLLKTFLYCIFELINFISSHLQVKLSHSLLRETDDILLYPVFNIFCNVQPFFYFICGSLYPFMIIKLIIVFCLLCFLIYVKTFKTSLIANIIFIYIYLIPSKDICIVLFFLIKNFTAGFILSSIFINIDPTDIPLILYFIQHNS